MEINKLNSLIELYFIKSGTIDKDKQFLKWLKPNKTNILEEYFDKIFKLSEKIRSLIVEGDRCLILSEIAID